MHYDVMVIGGGAAGMMAAGFAAKSGKRTILIEKNPVLGKKLLITGKGRCNITNYCDVHELVENIPINGKFLINTFYQFNSYDTISFFSDLGLEVKIERGNRVFPASDKAKDVVQVLIKYIHKNKVEVLHTAVESVMKFGSLFAAKLINGEVVRAEKLIIATGGKSYPGTGSTGDGYKFAREFGHKLTRFKPSLVPIEAKQFVKPCEWSQTFTMVGEKHSTIGEDSQKKPFARSIRIPALKDLGLKNVKIRIIDRNSKIVYEDFGEMEFTNYGVTGPIILSASSHLRKIEDHILSIDLKPALSEEKLDLRLQREFQNNSNKQFKTILKNLLPIKMIPVFNILLNIPENKKGAEITKPERSNLLYLLKNFQIELEKFRPIQEAIITSGGVNVKEIDPKTMESKLVPGLFFAGEILDCDAYTGGFNLQIAWSTGFVAGNST
ncbi:MAG: NAD(P)/FAD-dependent oxidoreductase [Candidatus Cloacimonetes bacterium]|nr:NAD(P)/FAD-dependent oxidoreductase [Candidatus Cloacimonadota bacterium]MCF7814564.1 NAD(P)/FAD-dependent oxidoreductase [Candidatus Cloacimonadota bacterium]MCF7867770.1 NAD(P)/FAD-dependent oxidoreductase [Candidatus Cloacimonadota bacterium]MCF7883252.1 NAD(P)/FAD-dependent oxidoreductase [Candidatus Cloacimonadota bacterium]